MGSRTAGGWGRPPPLQSPRFPLPVVAAEHPPPPEPEEAALAMSDQRTLYLVNIFIGSTARFLNSFSAVCQDKLAHLHRRVVHLDASLTLLEAKLRSACDGEDYSGRDAIASCSQSAPRDLTPLDGIPDSQHTSGESSRSEGLSAAVS